jgi:hypothetical protein
VRANCKRAGKDLLYLLWSCIRSYIDVFGNFAAKQIAHTTAGEVSGVTVLTQTSANRARSLLH